MRNDSEFCTAHSLDRNMAGRWMILALTAMLISLIYALVLVLARTGSFHFFGNTELGFKVSLVLHVNFSLLIWFMCFSALLWSAYGNQRWRGMERLAQGCSVTGILILATSPIFIVGKPVMGDYLPVINHPVFYSGLLLFSLGISLAAIRIVAHPLRLRHLDARVVAIYGSAVITLIAATTALITWWKSLLNSASELSIPAIFWGAGHLLQLSHLLLLLFCWIVLSRNLGWISKSVELRLTGFLTVIILCALPGPFVALSHAANETPRWFTYGMEISGTSALVMLVWIALQSKVRYRLVNNLFGIYPLIIAIACILFIIGSLLGFMITENNALVPAHYHGMISAVTISFMGVGYYLLKQMKCLLPSARLIGWQSSLYGFGMLLMLAGLWLSDVPRKAISMPSDTSATYMVGKWLMAVGGGLGIMASMLFVLLLLQALLRAKEDKRPILSPLGGADRA